MAAGGANRKLMCTCGKPLGTFTPGGLELYCRFSKDTTTVPYTINDLKDAIAFVEQRRRPARPSGRRPSI